MFVAASAFWLLVFCPKNGAAQNPDWKIFFENPSFEDKPGESKSPKNWVSLAVGSTPDIFPGAWKLNLQPHDGKTCIGLVTREDGTSEEISQMLPTVLEKGRCYTFSIYLSHAEKYVGYNLPTRLRIWGGAKTGEKSVLLATSELVKNGDWQLYKFQFVPSANVQFITFQAFFAPGAMFFYKGNILLDACSPIERCDRA